MSFWAWLKYLLVAALAVPLLYAVFYVQHWLQGYLHQHPATWFLLCFGCLIYLISMTLPFFPGVELGLVLMMIFGWVGIGAVYLSTQIALNLAYFLGYHLTEHLEQRFVDGLNHQQTPRWIKALIRQMEKYPGLVFVGLINLPGNAMIGGAGGIAALYGVLAILPPWRFALLALLATLPLPILCALSLWWGTAIF